jgi:hypothetical protein
VVPTSYTIPDVEYAWGSEPRSVSLSEALSHLTLEGDCKYGDMTDVKLWYFDESGVEHTQGQPVLTYESQTLTVSKCFESSWLDPECTSGEQE